MVARWKKNAGHDFVKTLEKRAISTNKSWAGTRPDFEVELFSGANCRNARSGDIMDAATTSQSEGPTIVCRPRLCVTGMRGMYTPRPFGLLYKQLESARLRNVYLCAWARAFVRPRRKRDRYSTARNWMTIAGLPRFERAAQNGRKRKGTNTPGPECHNKQPVQEYHRSKFLSACGKQGEVNCRVGGTGRCLNRPRLEDVRQSRFLWCSVGEAKNKDSWEGKVYVFLAKLQTWKV